jgi:hypothetical protein
MNPSEWEMSVVRFTSECGLNLPILLFQVDVTQDNINQGIYSITLALNATYKLNSQTHNIETYVQVPIMWIPENQNVSAPASVSPSQNINNQYYWVYTYSHFCDLINNAFSSALENIQSQFSQWVTANWGSGQSVPTLSTKAPFIKFNPTTNLFSIYYHSYGYGGSSRTSAGTSSDENFTLYFDSNLFALLGNFKSLYVGKDADNGETYQLVVSNDLDINIYTDKSSNNYYTMTQDYSSLSTIWSPISAIAFKSNTLPTLSEFSSNPVLFDESNVNATVQSNNLTERIITDISLPLDYPHQYRELLNYTPGGEYRMISMMGYQPITKIDISVWYRMKMTNQLIPMIMPNQSTVSCKLMFRRRK